MPGTERAPRTGAPEPLLPRLRSAGGGEPLAPETGRRLEEHFGHDLRDVRVHADPAAARMSRDLGARAFTWGRHLFFGAGSYRPQTPEGQRLLAHEVAHALQQRQGGAADLLQREPDDAGTSAEAPPDVQVHLGDPAAAPPSTDPLVYYPAIVAALDPEAYLKLRNAGEAILLEERIADLQASGGRSAEVSKLRRQRAAALARGADTVQVPLERLQAIDTQYVPTASFGDTIMPLLLTGSPEPGVLALIMRNEAVRRFMTEGFPKGSTVGVHVAAATGPRPRMTPPGPRPVAVSFTLCGQSFPARDGLVHLAQLDQALGGRMATLVADVTLEAQQLADLAGYLISGRRAVAELPKLVAGMISDPSDYALADVTAMRQEMKDLTSHLAGFKSDTAPPGRVSEAQGLGMRLQALLPLVEAAYATVQALHQRTAVGSTSRESADYLMEQSKELHEGGYYLGSYMMARSSAEMRVHSGLANVVTGGAISDLDRSVLEYRAGTISLNAFRSLTRHALIKAGIALGISVAAGALGGWLGGLAGRAVFGAETVGAALTASTASGASSGLAFVGAQDVYSLTAAALSNDPAVKQRLAASTHSAGDYLLAGGIGAGLGLGFGALGLPGRAPRGVPPGEPVLLYDAAGQPIRVQGGQVLPRPEPTLPITLLGPDGRPLSIAGAPEAAGAGPVVLLDAAGQPRVVTPQGLAPPSMQTTTLTGESRLVGPGGEPLSGGPSSLPILIVDASGRPVATPQTGPTLVDLQAGTPGFLQSQVGQTPGARGIGVESGRWILGYQGIHPVSPQDLSLSLQIARNAPLWPDTPAWRTPISGMPRLLPWEIDPATHLFPSSGPVIIVPDAFFPPVGQQGGLIPLNIGDIAPGGIQPTTHPALYGAADQIYLRRPFGLAAADPGTTVALGQELNRMLKPGGFVEFRLRGQAELSVPTAGSAGPDQLSAVVSEIHNARVIRVDRGAIERFQSRGILPADAEQAAVLRNAASDLRGLGKGSYVRIIRIYKGPTVRPGD